MDKCRKRNMLYLILVAGLADFIQPPVLEIGTSIFYIMRLGQYCCDL